MDTNSVQRNIMVDTQIKARGIRDAKVLDAMRKVERHLFVPEGFVDSAYADMPLPIGCGQTISQPYIVAYMTEALRLKPTDRILEIGTGCGYQAAVLGEIVKEVYSIEVVKSLAEEARVRLERLGYKNIRVKWGDGYDAWQAYAPYDAIIATASPVEIPQKLVEQLKPGGKMILPVGSFFQELYLVEKTETGVREQAILPVRFVPMVHPREKEFNENE
ncbi:MAG: protein-L-isoaspartate(D-aspartate) O-methyltransferase [Candidatus Omnitrophica bacterium]|nr:protein-L-isoaspartate(D-aspartate) O-methyltransferase [Candidatus Omnitrophota bacterium]